MICQACIGSFDHPYQNYAFWSRFSHEHHLLDRMRSSQNPLFSARMIEGASTGLCSCELSLKVHAPQGNRSPSPASLRLCRFGSLGKAVDDFGLFTNPPV